MIKFYTPSNWRTVFEAPSIIIDDDGLIYTESEYYKLSKTACGRVDIKTGYIYGKGHYSGLTAPIGMVKQGHNCIEIYGDDFASIMAVPIYYIQGDSVYTAEEYGKVFKQAEGYIKREVAADGLKNFNEVLSGGISGGDGAARGTAKGKANGGCLSVIWSVIKSAVIVIGLLVLSLWIWNEMYFTEDNTRFLAVNVICLLIGLVAAVFKKDKDTSVFTVIFWVSTILFGLYMGIGNLIESGIGFKQVLLSIISVFLAALYCLAPSLLLSVGFGLVKLVIFEIRRGKKKEGNK